MATAWDDLMKLLVGANPQHFVSFVLPNAIFKHFTDKELKARTVDADLLCLVEWSEEEVVLHGEYQRYRDSNMARRMWEYNALTDCLTKRKVCSIAIYLRPGGTIVESPYVQYLPDGQPNHIFYFRSIKLWEIPYEEFLKPGIEGLLPLIPLAEGGTREDKIDIMISALHQAKLDDLLVFGYTFAAAVYDTPQDKEWLKRRFAVLHSTLEGSWAYEEIVEKGLAEGLKKGLEKGLQQGIEKGLEKGIEKGLEKGIQQGRLQTQRQSLVDFVEARFPKLTTLAKERAEAIKDFDTLHRITSKLFKAQTVQKAHLILLEDQSTSNTPS